MKLHIMAGGVTAKHIIETVEDAEECSRKNADINPAIETILFFDEANTTSEVCCCSKTSPFKNLIVTLCFY